MLNLKTFFYKNFVITIVITLFFIIILLSLYLFNIVPSNNKILNSNSTEPTQQTDSTIKAKKIPLIKPSDFKTYTNDTEKWQTIIIPKTGIKVSSDLQITSSMQVKFADDAPENSTTGINFSNSLPENDPNSRKIAIHYYLKNKQWLFKYQSGNNSKIYGLIYMNPNSVFGTFTLSISPDGKTVTILQSDGTTNKFDLPNSLYDTTNQLSIKAFIGPKSSITFSTLNFQIYPK